ncbi:MAG: histidine kinase [Acidimicrobiales bacterium]
MAGVDERARPVTSRWALRLPGPGRWVTRSDLLLAAVLLVLQLGSSALAEAHHGSQSHLDPAEWTLLLVGPLAFLAWRRHPVLVMWATFLATVGPAAPRFGYLSLIVAFFLVAISGHRLAAWAVIVVGYVGSLWLAPLVWGQPLASLDGALALGGWLAVLVVAAEVVRLRRERVAESRAARQVEARRRASEERLQMARDLHDVIGHNISLITVQAEVGLELMDSQPEQARAALAAIKTVSKDALGELRTMLAALREDGDEAPRSPTPGLGQLGDLVALSQATGLQVNLEMTGPQDGVPAATGLTAYRIVQEALTNVTRHAPGATVTVRIGYRPDAVLVEIVDSGSPSPWSVAAADHAEVVNGTGIDGMRERAKALGGDLEATPRSEGGFRVAARLPLVATG